MRLKCNHWTTFCRKPRLQKCRQFRAMANFAKTPKSANFWNSSKGGPRENGLKSRPNSQAPKTPRRKSHWPLNSMRLKCNHWTTFCSKPRLQKCRQFRAMANFAKTPKSAIFWNSSKGGPRENGLKSRPNSQAPKTPQRKSHRPLISMHLKCNHWTTFCRKPRLQKCRQFQALANFAKTLKSAIFWNSSKGGPRENGLKSRPNSQAPKTPRRKSHCPLICMRLKCNHWTTFCRKPRLQKCGQFRAMANFAKTPKSAIFWNSSKRNPRENGLKSRPNSQAPKTPRRKSHRPLISMRLKCNHWNTFCRKPRLQKCRQFQAMANFAKTPKSAIFWNSSKGGPRENGLKSRPNSQAPKTPQRKSHRPLISMRLKCNRWTTFRRKPRLQKCRQFRAMANFAKTPKSAIFWNSSKGWPRENGLKSRPNSQAPKKPRRKSHCPLITIRLKCHHWTTICRKPRLQKCGQFRAMANFAKTPKSAIFWNSSKRKPRENCLKSRPNSQAPKTPRRKSHRPLISMRLKCNHWTTFCRKPRLQKCRQFRAMANFAKTHKSAIFWNSSKEWPRENGLKSWPNSKAPKTPRRKSHRPWISMRLKCNHWKTFCRKPRLQKCRKFRAMANFAKTPKSAIFWNSSKEGPRENGLKSRPNSQAPKTPRRKFHRLLISMRLKCNHWTTFCRKPRLQKCRQLRAMANFAKTPKPAIFWNSSKGGPRENGLKSRPNSQAPTTRRRKSHRPLISMGLKWISGQHSAANRGSKSAGNSELWPILQKHQNRPFFEILQRGDQGRMA